MAKRGRDARLRAERRDVVRKAKQRRKRPTWTDRDNRRASHQGWAIFESGTCGHTLCRDDEVDAFSDDDAAARFVVRTAQGDGGGHNALARKALDWLARKVPEEYARVLGAAELSREIDPKNPRTSVTRIDGDGHEYEICRFCGQETADPENHEPELDGPEGGER